MQPILLGRLKSFARDPPTMSGMDGAFPNQLRIDGAYLRSRIRRWFRVDPKTVNPNICRTIGSLFAGRPDMVMITPIKPTVSIRLQRPIRIALQNHILVRNLHILPVCQGHVEVIQSPSVQHECTIPLLAQFALRQVTHEQRPLDTALFPLSCGGAEDVDHGIGG